MEKEKKNNKVVTKAPGKGKKFSFLSKPKVNSSDNFQINIGNDKKEGNKNQEFNYGGYENKKMLNNLEPNVLNKSGEMTNIQPNDEGKELLRENTTFKIEKNLKDDDQSDINDEEIKRLSDAYKRARKPQNCIFVALLVIISIVCLFYKGIVLIIGAVICFMSILGAIMKYQDRVKYANLVLYLSIIVALFYAFNFVFVNKLFGDDIDPVYALEFKDKAKEYIEEVRNTKVLDEKKVICLARGITNETFYLVDIYSDSLDSPFGGEIDKRESFVTVKSEVIEGDCQYLYSVYLTDGVYEIGSPYGPVKEELVEKAKVTKK